MLSISAFSRPTAALGALEPAELRYNYDNIHYSWYLYKAKSDPVYFVVFLNQCLCSLSTIYNDMNYYIYNSTQQFEKSLILIIDIYIYIQIPKYQYKTAISLQRSSLFLSSFPL